MGESPVQPEAVDPAVVARWFGPAAATAHRYAELLCGPGVQRGLVGPREAGRIWSRHLFNCVAALPLLPRSGSLADLGSGAGLPGLVLAIARPELAVLLVDSTRRRTDFLTEAVDELGLHNVSVRWSRAEELGGSVAAEVVTARAVAPLARLLPLAEPLLAPGGELLAWKGAGAAEELVSVRQQLDELSLGAELTVCGRAPVEATLVRVRRRPAAVRSGRGRAGGGRRGGRTPAEGTRRRVGR